MTVLLQPRMVEKPWGCCDLPAPFTVPAGLRIGEIWFEPRQPLPQLLAKYIFTSEALSVQVHPGGPNGKEECWLVISAEPDARVAIGFRQQVSPLEMRAAALDGSIEDLLAWHPVRSGDFFQIPPGTVHAIGAGIKLVEIQQANDITYRLYDYGRPRELHLDAGLAVALGEPHPPGLRRHVPPAGSVALVDTGPFRVDRIDGPPSVAVLNCYQGPLLVLPRLGTVLVDGEAVEPGQCAIASSLEQVHVPERAQVLIAQPA
jgi:mannose-6-phosphate isomerase